MKRLLLASVALCAGISSVAMAADLPAASLPRAPDAYVPVTPFYPYDWSGFYIGGNLGAG